MKDRHLIFGYFVLISFYIYLMAQALIQMFEKIIPQIRLRSDEMEVAKIGI